MVIAAVARKIILLFVAGFSLLLLARLARSPRPMEAEGAKSRGDAGRAAKRVVGGGCLGTATLLVAWFVVRPAAGSPGAASSAIPYAGILQIAALGFAVGSLLGLLSPRWNR